MKSFYLFVLLLFPLAAYSQQAEQDGGPNDNNALLSHFDATLELTTKYMWRGIEYGTSPVTFASLNYSTGGFSAYALGGYATNGSHQEVDLGISYSFSPLTIGLADYYYPSAVGEKDDYFTFKNRETGHSIEAFATVTPFKLPLWLTLSCYIAGADKNFEDKQAYSSYAELGYTYTFRDNHALSLALGANLNKGFYTDYCHGFNLVNATLKYATSFRFGRVELPVSASYILNPYKEKSYVSFSISFSSSCLQ